jgi:hypothetical protein
VSEQEGPKPDQVVMSDQTRKALEEQHALFKKTFGRDPAPDDPIIWDPDVTSRPVPLAIGRSERAFDTFCDIAERIGLIPPEIVHAMRKTRVIITDGDADTFSQEERDAWNAAVVEYRESHP